MYSMLWERPEPQTEDEWFEERLEESMEYCRLRDEQEAEQERQMIRALVHACLAIELRPTQRRILAMVKACAERGMRRKTLNRLIADAVAVEKERNYDP